MNLIKDNWSKKAYTEFLQYLKTFKDPQYLEFNQKIVSSQYKFIGIRIPILRNIAKKMLQGNYESFLKVMTLNYYEEILLRGFIIAGIKDIPKLKEYITFYVLLIDNWAICDSFCSSLKIIKNNKKEFWPFFNDYLNSKHEFSVRVAIVVFLNYYVEKEYLNSIYEICQRNLIDKYYVDMAISWLICECFIKYPSATFKFLQESHLKPFIFNKALSKIKDSYQVSKEAKANLEKLKKAKICCKTPKIV